jgi:hypothetical protein
MKMVVTAVWVTVERCAVGRTARGLGGAAMWYKLVGGWVGSGALWRLLAAPRGGRL